MIEKFLEHARSELKIEYEKEVGKTDRSGWVAADIVMRRHALDWLATLNV